MGKCLTMKYSKITWAMLTIFAVLMVGAVGQNMGLFALGAPSGYVWNDNDVLKDVGTRTAVFPTHTYTTLYKNDFRTDDDMIRVSTVGSAGWGGGRYVYGEYVVIVTDGNLIAESERFGSTGNEVLWYVDIQDFNKNNLNIMINGKKAQYGYDYINGLRGGTCSGDCRSHDLSISSIGISSNKNEPPIINYSINPLPVIEGEGSIFDASSSYSPLDSSLTYAWSMGDGAESSERVLTHVYENAGSYVVTLTVSDGLMTSTKTDIIKVQRYSTTLPASEPPVNDTLPSEPSSDVNNVTIMFIALGAILGGGIVVRSYIKKR